MVQDRAIITTVDQYKVVYDLSIGDIFNNLDSVTLQISRAGHAIIRRLISLISHDTVLYKN